jgi:hypothetical protein
MNIFIFTFAYQMKIRKQILVHTARRKFATILFVAISAAAAFATLGDGKSKGKKASLLNNRTVVTPGRFSIKSGYQYRGSQVVNQQRTNEYITFNSLVTYQKGHMTYILPVKTVVPQKIKVSVGIPQMNK